MTYIKTYIKKIYIYQRIIISAGPTSNVLMKVSLDLVKQDDCNQSYSSTIGKNLAVGINPISQICAGEKEGGKDTCQVRKDISLNCIRIFIILTNMYRKNFHRKLQMH